MSLKYRHPDLAGAMINRQRLKLPISRINFHGPKDVRAIEVRLIIEFLKIFMIL